MGQEIAHQASCANKWLTSFQARSVKRGGDPRRKNKYEVRLSIGFESAIDRRRIRLRLMFRYHNLQMPPGRLLFAAHAPILSKNAEWQRSTLAHLQATRGRCRSEYSLIGIQR